MVKLPQPQKTDDTPLQTPRASATGGQGGQMTDDVSLIPPPPPPSQPTAGPGLGVKEREFLEQQEAQALEEVRKELEIAPEVKEAGVEIQGEEIELPPALPKMGVSQTGAELPVSPPRVTLPLTDDKIMASAGFSIWASITWLAQWCLKQLKRVHIKLKKVQGTIVRIVIK